MSKKKYTEEFLLSELKRFYKENGRSPTIRDFNNDKNYPTFFTYKAHFGSWNNALKLVGLQPKDGRYAKIYTKTFLIQELQRFYIEYKRSPTYLDLTPSNGYPSGATYIKHFITFNAALEAAELNINCLREYSREFLISELKRFYNEYRRNPTSNDLTRSKGYPSLKVYNNYFDSLESALIAADLNTILYNRESLIKDIHNFINTYRRVPTSHDLHSDYNMHSSKTYTDEFGSWNNALIEAGIDVNAYYTYDKLFLIAELNRFYNENGRFPKATDLTSKNGYPSISAYSHHFTSLNNALLTAGLSINKVNKYDYTNEIICATCGRVIIKNCNSDGNGNTICQKCWTKTWRKNNYDKFLKSQHKRRGYGFIALNKKYKGSHAHHLWLNGNEALVVYIPNFLHGLHWHNHDKPETMGTINAIALDIWIQESLYKELYLTGGE